MNTRDLPPKVRDQAHTLRQALIGALEMHRAGRDDRSMVETVGLRDYKHAFGHEISAKTLWRLIDRVHGSAGAGGDLSALEHYLPVRWGKAATSPGFNRISGDFAYARFLKSVSCG